LKTPLALSLLVVASFAFGQTGSSWAKPPVDRAKLPPNLRNLPLERMSSGALMLLNRDNNLVLPPLTETSLKGATITQEAVTAPVALDLRIGPNIRLGNDPAALPASMRAQAEPHIARSINTEDFLAGVFQEGRFTTNGGAVDCGYSISHDGGLTWTRALIPNLTMASGGPYFRATDPVAAFDLNNNLYLETLVATDSQFANGAVVLSKSTDGGATFASPVVVYQPGTSVFPDKEWMAINTFAGTATAGRILVTFSLFTNVNASGAAILRTYSTDTGFTWSSPAAISSETTLQGSQPLFLPNGNCVVVYWNFGNGSERLEAVNSTDGGTTFGSPHLITLMNEYDEPSIRTGSILPSAVGDRTTQNVYVVYQGFLAGSPRVAFTKSSDGGITWSSPIAISNNPAGSGVFNPAINASPDGRTLTVIFYDHRNNPGSNVLVDLYLAQSFDFGNTWQPNIRLTSVSTDASLAPLTSEGYMLGDYLGVAQTTRPTVPAVPIWVDTRTGNPDPFITRAGIAPYLDLVTAWEAKVESLPQVPATSLRSQTADVDRDGEDNQSEAASGTGPNNPAAVTRTGKELDISTRLRVETGQHLGIAGFIISGSLSKKVVMRALGPSLGQLGVPDTLQDPAISLFDSSNNLIASNDNWKTSQQSEIQASGYAPGDDREPAMVQTLAPGNYTVVVRGVNATSGATLVEVHDLDPASSRLTNISTRGVVGTGADVMIGGFVVGDGLGTNGDGSSEVVVRALGPELTSFGIADALQDPQLELYDSNGNLLMANDNWKESQQTAIQATGLAPGDDREPAILATLIQGNWTAILRGKSHTTGTALIELYRIH
jgi:BNR repeat-like domain